MRGMVCARWAEGLLRRRKCSNLRRNKASGAASHLLPSEDEKGRGSLPLALRRVTVGLQHMLSSPTRAARCPSWGALIIEPQEACKRAPGWQQLDNPKVPDLAFRHSHPGLARRRRAHHRHHFHGLGHHEIVADSQACHSHCISGQARGAPGSSRQIAAAAVRRAAAQGGAERQQHPALVHHQLVSEVAVDRVDQLVLGG